MDPKVTDRAAELVGRGARGKRRGRRRASTPRTTEAISASSGLVALPANCNGEHRMGTLPSLTQSGNVAAGRRARASTQAASSKSDFAKPRTNDPAISTRRSQFPRSAHANASYCGTCPAPTQARRTCWRAARQPRRRAPLCSCSRARRRSGSKDLRSHGRPAQCRTSSRDR